MNALRHLQLQWDEEAAARTAVRDLRLAMAAPRRTGRTLLLIAMPVALLVLDRIIAGLVAASYGVAS